MERLTVNTPMGPALNMDDTYPTEDAAREDLMQKFKETIGRLAAYEDTGLTAEEIKQLSPESNNPLTLEELKRMDGEPVWCVDGDNNQYWCLVNCGDEVLCCYDNETGLWDSCFYGMTGDGKHGLHQSGWLAYRHKLEEKTP